jgi:hypothetical protein
MTAYRSSPVNDHFICPITNRRYTEAVLRWDEDVEPGSMFLPWARLASVEFGEVEAGVFSRAFGTVQRLLVEDGATVRPGEDVVEVVERSPTLAEWEAEQSRADAAEARVAELEPIARNPFRSVWYAVRR